MKAHWAAFNTAKGQVGQALASMQEAERASRTGEGPNMTTFREKIKELYISMHGFSEMEKREELPEPVAFHELGKT